MGQILVCAEEFKSTLFGMGPSLLRSKETHFEVDLFPAGSNLLNSMAYLYMN